MRVLQTLSKLPKRGFATNAAIKIEETAVNLPTFIKLACDGSFLEKFLNTSIVKMVLTLLVIEANEDTIAAISAAKVNPSNPFGRSVIMLGYA